MAIIEENYVHFAEHPETILSSLHQLYTCNMFIDMCLVCHGCEIFAHKVIIAAASPLLRDRINEFGDCHARIELEHTVNGVDINIEDIKLLVEFIYKGQVCVPEARISLFLEVGDHFQVFGLYRQPSNNFGSPLSFLSQPSTNYNISQHPLPNLNLGSLQPYQDNINYDDPFPSQNDGLGPNFPGLFSTNYLMSPEKLSDSLIKQDKSLSAVVSNTSFSDLCSGNNPSDPYHLLREKNAVAESTNPKQNCTYQHFTNDASLHDVSELSTISNTSYPSDLSENSGNVQSENSKDVFGNESVLSASNLPDPNSFFHNINAETNAYFSADNLVQTSPNENCIEDLAFHPCKIPGASSLPERQMRLKVKDSIGGVSLQDTSQGEKGLLKAFPEIEELSDAVDSCQPIEEDQEDNEVQEDSIEAIEIVLDHPCSQCHRRFYSQDDLTNHLYEEHNIGTMFKCLACSFKTLVESCLVEHGKSHLGSVDRQCCICGKRFKTRATLRNHLISHASNKWFRCKECNAHYSQRNNLIKHLASEHRLDVEGAPIKESLSCSLCTFKTWAPHKLKNHNIRCHTVDKPFKCSECSYAATERTSLVKHVRTHTQERPYICDFCGLSFVTVSSLKRHCRGHTKEKPFHCKECGAQYADKKRLNDHLLKHKSIKPFKCDFCEYLCRRKDNLQSHIKRNHANNTLEEVVLEDAQEALL